MTADRKPAATDATPRTRITLSGPVRFFTDPQSGNTVIEYDGQEAAIPPATTHDAALDVERLRRALIVVGSTLPITGRHMDAQDVAAEYARLHSSEKASDQERPE